MREFWTYDSVRRIDRERNQWHFVRCDYIDDDIPYEERPYEVYFRDNDREAYGVIRFEKKRDNPYRDYSTLINKIMNNKQFREKLLDVTTKSVWRKNWK